jgi:endonuclease YncB( thermonuclease family)
MTCRLTWFVVFGALLWAPAASADEFVGKVVGVSDGDTLTVLRDRVQVKIRLHGIDCPESSQDFGTQAKKLTSELAFGQLVTVRPHDTDRYGRTVADVVLPDGRLLNHELVRRGMAWHYRQYARHDGTLSKLEAEARSAKRGLWSKPNPIPPWAFRDKRNELPAELATKVLGNRRSRVYHKPGCRNAATIAESNRVVFDTAAAAEQAGYRPGKDGSSR